MLLKVRLSNSFSDFCFYKKAISLVLPFFTFKHILGVAMPLGSGMFLMKEVGIQVLPGSQTVGSLLRACGQQSGPEIFG